MALKSFSFDDMDDADPLDKDDDCALADGMTPDSRIVELIDELEVSCDEFDESDDEDKIITSLRKLH
ncbi:hypothetical protein [Nitrosomonas sp.]|uniref:hypothetical protein n=1 Tax=Nitrosomonas sp. TaxID=42353 RepID=UPI0025EB1C58|nr:hypothetical protein [Nitrosomonas sp.]MBV6448102.1 hypothetical protein [Nitrosomonas sp.]